MYDDNDPDTVGTAQNLLDGTQPATITVQTTAAGDTVNIRGQNLSGLLAAVAGLVAAGASEIDDADNVATSYPGFVAAMSSLGATVVPE